MKKADEIKQVVYETLDRYRDLIKLPVKVKFYKADVFNSEILYFKDRYEIFVAIPNQNVDLEEVRNAIEHEITHAHISEVEGLEKALDEEYVETKRKNLTSNF